MSTYKFSLALSSLSPRRRGMYILYPAYIASECASRSKYTPELMHTHTHPYYQYFISHSSGLTQRRGRITITIPTRPPHTTRLMFSDI